MSYELRIDRDVCKIIRRLQMLNFPRRYVNPQELYDREKESRIYLNIFLY
jgi:hypothetical protein